MPIWSAEIKELEKLYESFRDQLPDLEKELGRLIKADDENMVLLYSRRCLEVIICDLCECELKRERGTEPLKGIIDKLYREKIVPPNIITSMHGLNELSTYGAHPKDFDPEQVKPVLVNLDIIIKWYLKYRGNKIKTQTEEKTKAVEVPAIEETKEGSIIQRDKLSRINKHKILTLVLITAILIIAVVFAFQRIFKRDTLESLRASGDRISISVMPFQNMTNDTINWNDYQYIIQTSLTSYLSNFPEYLQVRQTESINDLLNSNGVSNYASFTPSFAGKISKKLDSDVFIYGNIIKSGSVIRIIAQLIDTKTEEIIKSFQMEGPSGEVNFLPKIDSLSGMVKDYLIISELKKGMGKARTSDAFFQVTTNSPEAYKYFIYGMNATDNRTAIEWYKKAIAVDSNFVLPYTNAIWSYIVTWMREGNIPAFDSARKLCLKIYEIRDRVPLTQQLIIKSEYAYLFETSVEQNRYLQQILNNDDQQPNTYYMLGYNCLDITEYDKAISAFIKGIEVYEKWGVKPSWLYTFYDMLLQSYIRAGRYNEGKALIQKYQKDYPNANLSSSKAIFSFLEGDSAAGKRYVEEMLSVLKKNQSSEESTISELINIYSFGRMPYKAREYCHKLHSLHSLSLNTLNIAAWRLLFDDRNASEALELAERALALSPENDRALHRKGWALYQLGKYEEALEVMNKSKDIRIKISAPYNHEFNLHLEAVKKAVASRKSN